ncbi:MAG: hypothetical protein E7300_09715 [Lachnospiraceae bacterium]|nr:hypothetical protein [Lachnospiraceae bacterium]
MNTQEAKKSILFFIILFSFVLAFLFLTGCMTHRGQFVDDHETVTWTIDGLSSIISIFKGDIHIGRFRPLYVLFRICKKLAFGENFFLWHLWHAFLTALTGTLIFVWARLQNLRTALSVLLVCLGLIGPQSEVWYRLGPQEIEGTLFLVLALIAADQWLKSASLNTPPRYSKAWCTCCIVSSVLSTWCKESFAVLVPVLMIYVVLLSVGLNSGSDSLFSKILYAIRRTILFHVVLTVVTLINAYIVIKKTTLLGIGYAGVDTKSGLNSYIYGTLQILTSDWIPFLLLLIGIVFCLALRIKNHSLHNGWLLIPAVLLVLSQLFIYNKSGMFGRYYLPFAFSLILVWTAVFININEAIWTSVPVLYLIVCFFIYSISGAKDYAFNDQANGALMDFIESHIGPNSVVVVDHWAKETCLSIEQYASHDGLRCYFFGIDENADCYPLNDYPVDTPWDKKHSDYIITNKLYDETPDGFCKIWEGDIWIVYQRKN